MMRSSVLAWGLAFAASAAAQAPLPSLPELPAEAPAAAPVMPGPGAAQATPAVAEKPAEDAPKPWWSKVPPVQPLPRLGYSPTLPTGPGYYSLLDEMKGEYSQKPPKYPYPRSGVIAFSFFDADWRYLDDPENTEW